MLICCLNNGTYEIYGEDHAHPYCEYVCLPFSDADLYVILWSLI